MSDRGLVNVSSSDRNAGGSWRILIVDDDPDILLLTSALLSDVTFEGRPIELATARSGAYARDLLEDGEDFAVAVIDVAMETNRAGLDLVEFIRFVQNNQLMRIVLRTARADEAPPWDTICHYEIDAYVDKTESDHERFLTSLGAALRAHHHLQRSQLQSEQLMLALRQRDFTQRQLWQAQKLDALGQIKAGLAGEISAVAQNLERSNERLSEGLDLLEHASAISNDGMPAALSLHIEHALATNSQCSNQLASIAHSLNVFVSPDDSKFAQYDLNDLISDVMVFLRPQLKQVNRVQLDLTQLPPIKGSASDLGQALLNIILNATQALGTNNDGQLAISTRVDGEAIVIDIRDNGPGLADEVIAQVSDPTYIVKTIGEGATHGLVFSYYIVNKLYGGQIEVIDAKPGAHFVITLPATPVATT